MNGMKTASIGCEWNKTKKERKSHEVLERKSKDSVRQQVGV